MTTSRGWQEAVKWDWESERSVGRRGAGHTFPESKDGSDN